MTINYPTPTVFGHHRDGWGAATRVLSTLHDPNGIRLYDWADRVFKDGATIDHPWCGFLHNVLSYPAEYPAKYTGRIYPISELVTKDFFRRSLKQCRGLYTLAKNVAGFLTRTTDARVVSFTHPVESVGRTFSWAAFENGPRRVVSVGQWLRRYHAIYDLTAPGFEKMLLCISAFNADYAEMRRYTTDRHDVTLQSYLPNDRYDDVLCGSVVFLDLYDCAACNTVLECVIRNTPILINVLPGTVEHLGPDYPLYYGSVEEASEKINDLGLIFKAHKYLKDMDKSRLCPRHFLRDFLLRA